MFCGAGSFPRVDEDPWSPPPARVSKGRRGGSNPYSTRGLDKFSMVLADLESRRERIMAKAGAQGVADVVRFVYSSSHGWVPIVVRPRDEQPEVEKPNKGPAGAGSRKKPDAAAILEHPAPPRRPANSGAPPAEPTPNRVAKKGLPGNAGGRQGGCFLRRNPSYYWPAVVGLILLCLAFGRAFAICCTSIWWFSAPRMVDESRNVRKATKKDYRRRTSGKKLGAAAGDVAAPPAHAKNGGELAAKRRVT